MFKKIKGFILDTLFPISCVSCGENGIWLCEPCLQKISLLSFQLCPKCERIITEKGRLCNFCKHAGCPLDGMIAATRYKENNLFKLIRLFKYNFAEDLHIPLGRLLVKIILKNNLALPDIIIPIPLHKRRLRWRGFNQSELLAKYVSANLTPGFSIPVFSDLIIRQKYTPPQMKIKKYSARRKNMQDAFEINKKSVIANGDINGGLYRSNGNSLKGKKILLIDDICTTGATLFECAKILKLAGAKQVSAAIIARQEFGK